MKQFILTYDLNTPPNNNEEFKEKLKEIGYQDKLEDTKSKLPNTTLIVSKSNIEEVKSDLESLVNIFNIKAYFIAEIGNVFIYPNTEARQKALENIANQSTSLNINLSDKE